MPWAQATSTVAVECFAPVSSSEVTCHWPLRDLVPKRVTPFLAFTLEQKGGERARESGFEPKLAHLVISSQLELSEGCDVNSGFT